MSYILDALKRADAERERGHVPGLHTQIPAGASADAHRTRRGLLWSAAALGGAAALAAVAWWWWPTSEPAALAPVSGTVSAADEKTPEVPVEPGPATSAAPQPALPILAPPPPRSEPGPSARAVTSPAPVAVPAPTAAPAAPAAPGTVTGTAGTAAPASTSPLGSSTAPVVTGQPGPVLSFAELSPQDRARLPAVNVSGSTYSQNPELRMLIVNGRVVQEGQDIAPGLRLETIGPRNAVLNHQGLRYSIGY